MGRTEDLRRRLTTRRAELGLTREDVAAKISRDPLLKAEADHVERETGKRPKTTYGSTAVGEWEYLRSHPPIGAMAAWARALNMRLHVSVLDANATVVDTLVPVEARELVDGLAGVGPEGLRVLRRLADALRRVDPAGKAFRVLLADIDDFERRATVETAEQARAQS